MKYCVTINDKRYEVEVEKGSAAIVSTTKIEPRAIEEIKAAAAQVAAAAAPQVVETPVLTSEASQVITGEAVKAPMPGLILDIKVSAGSTVKKGDTILLLEAMKMENEITAHVDGIVSEIRVTKGANVSTEQVLVVLR